jgi:short-subunit dehydrogenase
MKNPQHIVITGASSGLGAALARNYAAPHISLTLLGRNANNLEAVREACTIKGATVSVAIADVTDRDSMRIHIEHADRIKPIDLIIANAGISAGSGGKGESEEQARDIFAVNLAGVLNTVHPAITCMLPRRKGQVAIMSSLAGIHGLPSAPSYSASKAAVRYYGEGLRGCFAKQGIEVSVICPGYIKTPMTDRNDFYMPFLMDADVAARRIIRGLEKNTSRIAFPRRLYWPLWWLSCLSPRITDPIFAALPAKPSAD